MSQTPLAQLLGLTSPPVAIAFVDAAPPGVSRVAATEPASCSYWRRAAAGEVFYTVADDGLALSWWLSSSVFCNPPYGKAREPWVEKCINAASVGVRVVLLIPAATDTRCFQRAAKSADAVVFVRGRVKFGTLRPNRRQHAASHPSALIGWNVTLEACSTLGWRSSTTGYGGTG